MISAYCVSSLEKITDKSAGIIPVTSVSGFKNEVMSFQLVYRTDSVWRVPVNITVESELPYRIRRVLRVPVVHATYPDADDNYISRTPGLFPDLLRAIEPHSLYAYSGRNECMWIDLMPDENTAAGKYSVNVTVEAEDGGEKAVAGVTAEIYPASLPCQRLICCRWLHTDCLSEYYHVPVFSDDYWRITENFIRTAVSHGINSIMMPVHTPPLDTREGGERKTVQLVGITKDGDKYTFDTSRLHRWIGMCKDAGVQYFEMAHLFTQWGAKHAPKIVATVDGETKRIFGWDTDAVSKEYTSFLNEYIPALRQAFDEEGISGRVIWHISDEPVATNLENYLAAKQSVEGLLGGCRIMDALSDYSFYEKKVVESPIASVNHIAPFLGKGIEHLWAYYCCGQYKDVTNAFICMPSARSRFLAYQLFRYDIEGFLQWGYNFYHSQYSDYEIDPFATTDADGWVPAGDPFIVYPGWNGEAEDSIRLMVLLEAMQDLRAMQYLADLSSREYVVRLVEKELGRGISFMDCRFDATTLLSVRRKIDGEILKALNK